MKHFIAGLIFFLIISIPSSARTLSFESVLELAIKNSHDLKLSRIDIGISEAGVKEARSEYFPTISIGYNSGYERDLSDGGSTVTPVGDSILINNTRYQNSLSAGLQYNLFDFGIRRKKLKIAKKDKTQKKVNYSINMRDLKLKLADIYTKALLNQKEYNTNKNLLALNKELFNMHERMYEAGKNSRTEVVDQAIKVARITNKIDEIRTDFLRNLEDLSLYTGDFYSPEDLKLNYIEDSKIEYVKLEKKDVQNTALTNKEKAKLQIEAVKTDFFDEENLPENKYYKLEIEKKKAELSILNLQRLPHFKFYTNYYLYGTDPHDYWGTFGDIEDVNLSFRIAATLPVFTGFKNTAQRERVKLEIDRLKVEKEKKAEEVKNYYQKMYRQEKEFDAILSNQKKSLGLVQDKIIMLERLREQKLVDKISYLNQKSDLISQKLELEKSKINNEANKYKLNVLKQTPEENKCKQD